MEDPVDDGAGRSSCATAKSIAELLGLDLAAVERRDVYRAEELRREFGIDRAALDAYEGRGLLRPAVRGGERFYSNTDRTRLRVALLGELTDMSQPDIARLADYYADGNP